MKEQVLQAMREAGKPVSAGDVTKALGADRKEVDKAFAALKKEGAAFAAGAMFYVVVEELIPDASTGKHSNLSTIGFAMGFVLMMVLDVVMG